MDPVIKARIKGHFIEAVMQATVVRIGHVIAKIVALAHPIPDYKIHDE